MNSKYRSPVVWSSIAVMFAFAAFAYVTTEGGSTGAVITVGVALVFVVWCWAALLIVDMYRGQRDRDWDRPSRMPPYDEFL